MKLIEKISSEIKSNGEVEEIKWLQPVLHRMLAPQTSVLQIPNPRWTKLMFPFDTKRDIINGSAARATFHIHVPAYRPAVLHQISQGLQHMIYNPEQRAEVHQSAALKMLIQHISSRCPQFPLEGDLISISGYEPAYQQAIRFTGWSVLPCDFLQVKIAWDEWAQIGERVIDVGITLLFNQSKINGTPAWSVNRKGILSLVPKDWIPVFDLEKVRSEEVPQLESIMASPISIFSTPEDKTPSPAIKQPARKRIRLMNRFAISSDEE